jgi:hypothetical protein
VSYILTKSRTKNFVGLDNFFLRYGFIIIYLFVIIVVLGGGTLEYLQRFLQCIKYILLEFTSDFSFSFFETRFQYLVLVDLKYPSVPPEGWSYSHAPLCPARLKNFWCGGKDVPEFELRAFSS